MRNCVIGLIIAIIFATAGPLWADEVVFNNGDHLTGKIVTYDGEKLMIDSPMAGKISVDWKNVRTFSSDEPINVVLSDGTIIHQKIVAGPERQIAIGPDASIAPQNIPLSRIKKINPPPEKW